MLQNNPLIGFSLITREELFIIKSLFCMHFLILLTHNYGIIPFLDSKISDFFVISWYKTRYNQ